MLGQLLPRKTSGRDRDGARANRFAARDIVRRVTDNIDIGGGEIDRVFCAGPLLRKRSEIVAIVVIVGKGAKFEKIPDAIVRELELRAAAEVAGQESEHILRAGLKPRQQFCNAGQKSSLALRQFIRQKFEIQFKKGRGVFLRHRDILFPQDLVDDAGIGFARDLDAIEIVDHAELVPQHRLERSDPGSAGVDQSAIDVEKEEAFWNGRFQIADCGIGFSI